jgi:hypothetical protein
MPDNWIIDINVRANKIKTSANISLAKKRVKCFYEIFVLNLKSVPLWKFSAEIPLLRKAAETLAVIVGRHKRQQTEH